MEHTIYLVLAVGGCSLMLLQIVLQVFGLVDDVGDADIEAADMDADHGAAGNWFFGFLSFKALVAFCGVFGLTGLILIDTDMSTWLRILCALQAGVVAMLAVAWLMRMLHNLSSSGTLDIKNTIGIEGKVYLRIPAEKGGAGKVTLEVQGRSVELPAMTDGEEIATGARVRVTEALGDDTVKVEPA